MNPVIDTFTQEVNAHLNSDAKLVVALSGGLDSRVMLHCLGRFKVQNPQIDVRAVHVHHGLSEHAQQWAERCQYWCELTDIPFFVEYASLDLTSKQSLEAQAREARYQLLAKHVSKNDLLLTAQHADDQLETLLLALKRGSGPKGLAAMGACSAFFDGWLVRPFLSLRRQQLGDYAQQYELQWVEDESNQDTQFDRNFLRHDVIPVLSARWPEIQRNALRSAQLCFEQEQLLDELLEPHYQQALNADNSLCAQKLCEVSAAIRHRLLRRWFASSGYSMPSQKQLKLVYQEVLKAGQDANPKLIIGKVSVRRYQQRIYLVEPQQLPLNWQTSLRLGEKSELPALLGSVTLGEGLVDGMPIRAPEGDERVWVHCNPSGLTAHPEGRSGSRKLKKLFQEYHIPPWKRSLIPILMYNEKVVAVGDVFVCQNYVGTNTRFYWEKRSSTRN
ncbi:tRNA lysidine(34) synthetase TilS [Vibrio rarus]|uniref:tRNA lysidine(34) synthetase TilS n=1 Tax=Vibrio rarus TaxID=413403 RepID=UPI0021C2E7D9|nr:tRNA lysidine(34) synthetase TilS [Vibrio rarus]